MTSVTNQEAENPKTLTTIHRIYRGDDDIILRDPTNRRSFINRSAYAKLHRSTSSGTKRHSVDNLKGRFEDLARQSSQESEPSTPKKDEVPVEKPESFTPATFGYPKTAKLNPPLIKPKVKPKPVFLKKKDENSNVVERKNSESSDVEEIQIVLQPSASEESVDRIAKELSNFEMDGKLNRKRTGSIRKWFGLFGKDKKKKEEEKKQKSEVVNDNLRNESSFNRQAPQRQTVPNHQVIKQEVHEEKVRELEQEYAKLHVNRFHQIRQSFNDDKQDNYVVMESTKPNKTSVDTYMSTSVNKYIDTSSSASTESERVNNSVRDTPPRAQETNPNIRVVKPKASLPINTERPLPNPYQNEKTSPRTIERNLNKSDSKDYPDKASFVENGDVGKPLNSKPPLSPAKLKLPSNRDIYEPQPRVRSPIPTNKVSTEKIIATELLKSTRSPTPPKRVESKPPLSPLKPQEVQVVTNAQVHAPRRAQTPLENRTYTNVPLTNLRASTPVDLRMSVAMKLSPKKEEIRKSVEEYYWKELKKLKEEEDSRLYSLQVNGYYEDQARVKRSRSLSPHRAGRRSLSLPREPGRPNYTLPPQQPIPENQAVIYGQNFVRNNTERRSVDSLQRPIFRRGSLTKQEIYDNSPYNKRVSFSNSQQAWPTRNGYTQSPPQRRLERIDSELDDEVFMQTNDLMYGYKYVNEPVYSNRVLEQFRAQQYPRQVVPSQQMGVRRLSMDSISRQDAYGPVRRPVSNDYSRPPVSNNYSRPPVSNDYSRPPVSNDYSRPPVSNDYSRPPVSNDYSRPPVSNDYSRPLPQYPPSIYSSRQSMTDSNYGQKEVSVRNKYCDIYGQIHDAPQTGVVMGQLQNSPMVPPRQPDANSFVRGSRLTASANDLGRRYDNDNVKRYENDKFTSYENRPLPPLPRKNLRNAQISDTESGSDASEIQRIMQNKTKNKKRGLFGCMMVQS